MRIIFHSDINNCFASIEAVLDPSLRGVPVAVCGDPAARRGIVLAKSEEAKRFGVKTGDPVGVAARKCPGIRFVLPHFEVYQRYSRLIRAHYGRYSPVVEPFGLDECWLDMSLEVRDFSEAARVADRLRSEVRHLFGVTVSVGVSFCKVFAKLASDLRKPDAVTVVPPDHFREQLYHLPASAMLWVGPSTSQRLRRLGVRTLGDIERAGEAFMRAQFGKNGARIWRDAAGLDDTPVFPGGPSAAQKSVGHGTTLPADLFCSTDAWPVIAFLSERTVTELRRMRMSARGIQIYVRDSSLQFHTYQAEVSHKIDTSRAVADHFLMLLSQHYEFCRGVHALGVRLYNLVADDVPHQLELFSSDAVRARDGRVDDAVAQIQSRFGSQVFFRGSSLHGVAEHPGCFPGSGLACERGKPVLESFELVPKERAAYVPLS
ncbi:MAG: DNA polymerase IV [Proteobacteria bacterium]|nr:DNA polymerase IV [Pseudomonadota bacterium]